MTIPTTQRRGVEYLMGEFLGRELGIVQVPRVDMVAGSFCPLYLAIVLA